MTKFKEILQENISLVTNNNPLLEATNKYSKIMDTAAKRMLKPKEIEEAILEAVKNMARLYPKVNTDGDVDRIIESTLSQLKSAYDSFMRDMFDEMTKKNVNEKLLYKTTMESASRAFATARLISRLSDSLYVLKDDLYHQIRKTITEG